MKRLSALVLVLISFVAAWSAPAAFAQDLLLVANKADAKLSFVDAQTLTPAESTVATGRAPHEVAVTPDGARAFTANMGDHTLSVIDVGAREEVQRIDLAPYTGPHGLAMAADGQTLYVTVEGSQAVIEVNAQTGEVVRSIETGQEGTHMVILTPDEETLYAANLGSGTTSVIDLAGDGQVTKTLDTGEGTEGIAVTPDGEEVWVTARSGSVAVIDTETNEIVATQPVEGTPIRVEITPDGERALVSCLEAGEVVVFDVAARAPITRIETGSGPVGIQITPEGERAFVANTQDDTVTVIDLAEQRANPEQRAAASTLRTGQEPDGMAFVQAQ